MRHWFSGFVDTAEELLLKSQHGLCTDTVHRRSQLSCVACCDTHFSKRPSAADLLTSCSRVCNEGQKEKDDAESLFTTLWAYFLMGAKGGMLGVLFTP